jgi:hypothetical protein
MLTSVQGIYEDGVIKLAEKPREVPSGAHAIVTFLTSNNVDLRDHGIGPAAASELRSRLSAFAEDWNTPEMSVYDNYDASKSKG